MGLGGGIRLHAGLREDRARQSLVSARHTSAHFLTPAPARRTDRALVGARHRVRWPSALDDEFIRRERAASLKMLRRFFLARIFRNFISTTNIAVFGVARGRCALR